MVRWVVEVERDSTELRRWSPVGGVVVHVARCKEISGNMGSGMRMEEELEVCSGYLMF
jgi:hypothetical protein